MNDVLIGEGIEFDDEAHRYTVAGVELPSVTRILKPWSSFGYLPSRVDTTEAQIRGTAVHLATALWDRSALDEDALDPEIAAYVKQWARFRDAYEFEPELVEAPVAHVSLGYAGTLDRYGAWRGPGLKKYRTVLLDIKTGVADPSHKPQLAGYALPLRAAQYTIDMRATVYLSPAGYAVNIDDQPMYSDAVFHSALTFHKWRATHNLGAV